MRKSDTRVRASQWYPQESEIRLRPFSQPELAGQFGHRELRWYLEIGQQIEICVGAHDEDLAGDLAAMRKLASAAAEAAGLLEERIVTAAAVTA